MSPPRSVVLRAAAEGLGSDASDRYRQLFDHSPISTQLLSASGRTLEVNAAWEAFWGIRMQDEPTVSRPLAENEQLSRTGVLSFFERALRGEAGAGPPTYYDAGLFTPGGRERWIRTLAQPLLTPAGHVRELVVFHLELASGERREAERRLRALGLHLPRGQELSPREREVLQLLAQGESNKKMARSLHVSDNTVKFHVTSLFNKLGANTRAQAVALAVTRGWL